MRTRVGKRIERKRVHTFTRLVYGLYLKVESKLGVKVDVGLEASTKVAVAIDVELEVTKFEKLAVDNNSFEEYPETAEAYEEEGEICWFCLVICCCVWCWYRR